MRKIGVFLAGAIVSAAALPALAQDAQVSVTHAIDGRDLGLVSESLPVDVAVNDACVDALNDLTFGETRGPLPLPAPASYNVKVFLAGSSDCSGDPVINTDVSVLFGQAVNIVAHLNESGQPKATAFNTNLTDTGLDNTRIAVHHTAAAPMVDVILRRKISPWWKGFVRLEDLSNSEQMTANVEADDYWVRIFDPVSRTTVLGPVRLPFEAGTLYSILAVGTAGTDTFTVKIIETPTD